MTNPDFKSDIPQTYGDNKIVLMIRDPKTLYAYWETPKEAEEELKEKIKEKGLVAVKRILRIYDVTGPGEKAAFDFEVEEGTASWYVNADNSGRRWIAEVGLLCETGEFFYLARSNPTLASSGREEEGSLTSSSLLNV